MRLSTLRALEAPSPEFSKSSHIAPRHFVVFDPHLGKEGLIYDQLTQDFRL